MVNRGGSWGTVQELRVSEPNEKFEGMPLVGIYPVPNKFSYWIGNTQLNSTSMDYTLSASFYEKEKWTALWTESQSVTIPPNNKKTVNVTLTTPTDLQTGIYQGFLNFDNGLHSVNAPVSFVIKQLVDKKNSMIVLEGNDSGNVLYDNGYLKGAFDMTNRYMAGDWRQFYFDVQEPSINSAAIELSWIDKDTNLAVFVMDPLGKIIQTNVPSGVFGHFLGWPSLDWLGNSPFSQGGGFFPVKNKDDTSTVLYVPLNQTGTYTILAHSTLFGGNSTTEPITLSAQFSNISHEMKSEEPLENMDEKTPPEKTDTSTSSYASDPESEKDEKIIADSEQNIITPSQPDNSFNLGIGIGLVAGIAIGLACILIIRQKFTK